MRVENSGLGDDGEASGEAGDEIRDGRLQVVGRQPADYRDLPLTMLQYHLAVRNWSEGILKSLTQ